jgi:hypothetical protein
VILFDHPAGDGICPHQHAGNMPDSVDAVGFVSEPLWVGAIGV